MDKRQFILVFLMPMTKVLANDMHQHGTISPFDKQMHGHILHCELNKHDLKDIYCPHRSYGKIVDRPVIASDCGGKTSGAFPALGSYNASVFLSNTVKLNVALALTSRKFIYIFYGYRFVLLSQIDHPPQTI